MSQINIVDEYANTLVKELQEYMQVLVDTGFSIPSILTYGLDYYGNMTITQNSSTDKLIKAKALAIVARNLRIDPRSIQAERFHANREDRSQL